MSDDRGGLSCAAADDLASAYALGALDASEERAMSVHLGSCPRPHVEARSLIDAAASLPAMLEPIAPSGDLRRRLMATIAETPQAHRITTPPDPIAADARPRWWQITGPVAAVAAAALAVAVGLGVWGVALNGQLGERDAALRAVAGADVIHAVSGSAGAGWVLETSGQAMFMAEDLANLPADQLYELWLIGADGVPTAVGTVTDTDGVIVVMLERALGDAATFAVTVEAERVDEPTTEPILVASLGN